MFVHLDASTPHDDTHFLGARRNHRRTSHSHEHPLGHYLAALALAVVAHHKSLVALFDGSHTGLRHDVDATLGEQFAQSLGHIGIKGRQNLFAKLHHGNFHAIVVHNHRKLHADNAASHHNDALGKRCHGQQVVAGHGQLGTGDGQSARLRTGGNHDVLCRVQCSRHLHGVGIDKACLAVDNSHRGAVEQHLHSVAQLVHHFVLACGSGGIVHCKVARVHAPTRRLAHRGHHLGIATQSLGGDATAIQTGAAQLVALHERHVHALVGSLGGHFVAAGASTNYYQVKLHSVHSAFWSLTSSR